MKKIFVSAAFAVMMAAAASASADPTTVTSTWNGAGTVTFNGSATGTTSAFNTGGNATQGSAAFTDLNNNPYGYNVPNVNVDINAQVGSGGVIQSEVDRTASYAPLYGGAGQSIFAYAFSSDGSAALVNHTTTNYASLEDLGHYGVTQTPDGNTLEASGSTIALNYGVDTGVPHNGGSVSLLGTGSASLTQNFAGAGGHGFQLGVGGGDYQLATFSAQGIGTVMTGGVATGSLSVTASNGLIYGTGANPASIQTTIHYDTTNAGGASQVYNYGITGNTGN